MNMTHPYPSSCRRQAFALVLFSAWGLMGAGAALAGDEDTPLSLSLSQMETHDSNFSRSENPQAELVSTTSLGVQFDESYGRQNYRLNGTVSANRYAHYKELLNNESRDFSGNFKTGLLRDWELNLGGALNRSLNPIQSNTAAGARVVKNIRDTQDGNASLRYGVDSVWSVIGTLDGNRLKYSEPTYATLNAKQKSRALRVNYYVTDLLYYGLGLRNVKTDFPDRIVQGGITEVQNDHNIDLTANWQVTGVSNLDLLLSRRRSTYASDPDRQIKGWNGNLSWQYTPHGLLTYGLGLSRTTSADRATATTFINQFGGYKGIGTQGYDNNSTNLNTSVAAQLTGKIVARLYYSLGKTKYANIQDIDTGGSTSVNNAVNHNFGVSSSYQMFRSMGFACGANFYSQTRDQSGIRFQGRSVNCSGTFTLQ